MSVKRLFRNSVFSNSMGWSASMVGSPLRFWFWLLFLPLFTLISFAVVTDRPWSEIWSMPTLIIAFQVSFTTATRRLYLALLQGQQAGLESHSSQRPDQ